MKAQQIILLLTLVSILTSISCKKTNDDLVPTVNAGRIYSHTFIDEYSTNKRLFFYQANGLIDSTRFYLKNNKKSTAFFYYNNNNTIDYYVGPEFGLRDYADCDDKKKYFYNSNSLITKIKFQDKSTAKDNVFLGIDFIYNNNDKISLYLEHWNFQDVYSNYVWDGDNISETEIIVDYSTNCSPPDSTYKYTAVKSYYTYDLSSENNLRHTYDKILFTPKYLNKNLISQEMKLVHNYEFDYNSCTITLLNIDTVNIDYSYERVNGKVKLIRENGNVTDSISYYTD